MHAATPEELERAFGERVNAGDLDGMIACYEPAATLDTLDAGVVVGHDAIRAYFTALMGMQARIDMGTVRVVPLGEGLAVTHHDWQATLTGPDGQEIPMSGKATEVVRRQPDGRWLFLLDAPNLRD